jgi:hypothetical protein
LLAVGATSGLGVEAACVAGVAVGAADLSATSDGDGVPEPPAAPCAALGVSIRSAGCRIKGLQGGLSQPHSCSHAERKANKAHIQQKISGPDQWKTRLKRGHDKYSSPCM